MQECVGQKSGTPESHGAALPAGRLPGPGASSGGARAEYLVVDARLLHSWKEHVF